MLNAVDAQAVIECDSKWAADAIEAWLIRILFLYPIQGILLNI